jgi:hypothetical protein
MKAIQQPMINEFKTVAMANSHQEYRIPPGIQAG